jgi:pSer/pThr/pTyr-binding forkhead associated (FHA) protein
MRVQLIGVNYPQGPLEWTLCLLPATLGRGPEAGGRVPDGWVSRRHCEISDLNGTLVIRDLGSRHGTFINGLKVAEGHLMPGDRVTIGLTSLEVRYQRGTVGQVDSPCSRRQSLSAWRP